MLARPVTTLLFRILAALPLLVTNSDGQKSLGTAETYAGDRAPHGIAGANRRMRLLKQETYPIHIFIFAGILSP